jgi:hypothetical protein
MRTACIIGLGIRWFAMPIVWSAATPSNQEIQRSIEQLADGNFRARWCGPSPSGSRLIVERIGGLETRQHESNREEVAYRRDSQPDVERSPDSVSPDPPRNGTGEVNNDDRMVFGTLAESR